MSYTPTAWVDGSTPAINADNLLNIEAGIVDLDDRVTNLVGVKQIDSFAGVSDDAKFQAALAWVQAEIAASRRTWTLQFPASTFGPLTTTVTPFSGMRLIGPTGSENSTKNLEVGSGNYVPHQVTVTVGNGTSALFNGSGTLYDVNVSGVAFKAGNSTSQFWHQPSGTLFSCQFHSLSFDGFKHVFGDATNKALVTQVVLSGHWTVLNPQHTQFWFGGSDSQLWLGGYLNIGGNPSVSGAGKPLIVLEYLGKTDIGYLYVTTNNDWAGLQVLGSSEATEAINFFGGKYEGDSSTTRPVIEVQGGHCAFYGPWLAYVADTNLTNAPGVFKQTDGHVALYSLTYKRAAATAATFPMLYQTGGTAVISNPVCGTSAEQIRIRWADATTTIAPAVANGMSTPGDIYAAGNLLVSTTGKGLRIAEGSNAKMGVTAAMTAGSIVVSTTAVTANSRIFLTAQNTGGTPGALRVSARSAGTSFTITSTSGTDTSTVAWLINEPA